MNSVAYNSDSNSLFLKQLLQDEFGVVVAEGQEQQVTDRLDLVMSNNHIDSLQSLSERLHGDDGFNLRTNVLLAITGHNADWFSYPEILSVFNHYVLQNINVDRAQPYRVWLVGCGCGQTAYSLAMLADKYKNKEAQHLSLEIIATDSAVTTIAEAKKATFKNSFLTGLSNADKKKYMTQENDAWVINDSIKSMVSFSVLNPLFVNEKEITNVDLIICPEILVYYTVQVKSHVLTLFANVLNDSGMLITGEDESILPFSKQFTAVDIDAGKFYRKLK